MTAPSSSAFGPDRVEAWLREILAHHAGAHRRPAQSQPFHSMFELLDRKIGILQRQRGESSEAVWPRAA